MVMDGQPPAGVKEFPGSIGRMMHKESLRENDFAAERRSIAIGGSIQGKLLLRRSVDTHRFRGIRDHSDFPVDTPVLAEQSVRSGRNIGESSTQLQRHRPSRNEQVHRLMLQFPGHRRDKRSANIENGLGFDFRQLSRPARCHPQNREPAKHGSGDTKTAQHVHQGNSDDKSKSSSATPPAIVAVENRKCNNTILALSSDVLQ